MRIVPIYLAHLCNGGRRWRDYRKKDDEYNFWSIGRECGKMAYFNKQQRDQWNDDHTKCGYEIYAFVCKNIFHVHSGKKHSGYNHTGWSDHAANTGECVGKNLRQTDFSKK